MSKETYSDQIIAAQNKLINELRASNADKDEMILLLNKQIENLSEMLQEIVPIIEDLQSDVSNE